jgi:glycosyltransferase involved in cell wall biosynthesis
MNGTSQGAMVCKRAEGGVQKVNPLVSVVVPAYNCAEFIDETLESVYYQMYTQWELIVVDDGSTDETKARLTRHEQKIQYHYQRNQGTAAARNAGVRRARGDLIAFLDNDDIWFPEKLKLQVEAMEGFPECGLVFTDGQTFTSSGVRKHSILSTRLDKWINQHVTADPQLVMGWLDRELFLANEISSASGVMVRKECLTNVGGFDERIPIADDYDLWLRIAQRYPILLIRSPLYRWRWRDDSQSGPIGGRQHRWTEASTVVLEKHRLEAPREMRAMVRARLSRMYWDCARTYFWLDRFQEARRMLLGCLRHRWIFAPAALFLLVSYLSPSFIGGLRLIKRRVTRSWLCSRLCIRESGTRHSQ